MAVVDRILTTLDNPYDPYTQYDQWLAYDQQMGYYTNEYLARVCKTSEELSEQDHDVLIAAAMDEIVAMNPNMYKQILKEE